jgi:signal transduction histidine kinase
VRVPIARAEDLASRLIVTFDEIASLTELDRRAEAARRLATADTLMTRFDVVFADALVRGLDDVLRVGGALQSTSHEVLLTFVAWLAMTLALAFVTLALIERRVTAPMRALQKGLEDVERGELSVTVKAPAPDEIGELVGHFNQMTAVLRNRAERQGRVAAAGELLGGVAHEVNNPLMAIAALSETRLADPGLPAAVRTELESIVGEVHRAGQLLKGFIRFARPVVGPARPVDLNEVVRDAWDLIWFQFKADGVQGRLQLVPGKLPVIAVPEKLEQAFINVLGNAHQAVMRRGPPRMIVVRTLVEDGRATACVTDNGPGVADEVRDQLFRPFFSTQPDGRAGLGLYTSRLILRELKGDVTHQPTSEPGATFALWLPSAPAGALAPERTAGTSGSQRVLDGMSILLVDDEPTVRKPIAKFLARRGARVHEAGDGREALAALGEEEMDVVVTDLRMPTMDGIAFYREIQLRRPSLASRVLFLSGDVAQLAELGATEIAASRVLTKPIELKELEERILAQFE